jgi:hypothetical protein
VVIETGVSSTSLIREAETAALGMTIVSMVIMRKLMMMSIAYWMNAIMSPTCIDPSRI